MQYRSTAAAVVDYIKKAYGVEPEFLWVRTPNNAAFRHAGCKKWFAAMLLDTPKRLLGFSTEERADILNLKCDPRLIGSLLDGRGILPGYHMNKEHWITVLMDGSVPLEKVFTLIDMSYGIIDKKSGSM